MAEATRLLTHRQDVIPDTVLYYKQFWTDVLHTGSRVICNPAPTDTDDDYVVLTKPDMLPPLGEFLRGEGFAIGGSHVGSSDDKFNSYKKGRFGDTLNLILTDKPEFFEKFRRATMIATGLNLLEKPVRIMLFEAVFDGTYPDEADKQQVFLTHLHKLANDDIFRKSEQKLTEKYMWGQPVRYTTSGVITMRDWANMNQNMDPVIEAIRDRNGLLQDVIEVLPDVRELQAAVNLRDAVNIDGGIAPRNQAVWQVDWNHPGN